MLLKETQYHTRHCMYLYTLLTCISTFFTTRYIIKTNNSLLQDTNTTQHRHIKPQLSFVYLNRINSVATSTVIGSSPQGGWGNGTGVRLPQRNGHRRRYVMFYNSPPGLTALVSCFCCHTCYLLLNLPQDSDVLFIADRHTL
jgi:hypothetical protein